jgi:hypothetical protein
MEGGREGGREREREGGREGERERESETQMPVNVKGLQYTLSGNNFFGAISPAQKFVNCRRIDSYLSNKKKLSKKQKEFHPCQLTCPSFFFLELLSYFGGLDTL